MSAPKKLTNSDFFGALFKMGAKMAEKEIGIKLTNDPDEPEETKPPEGEALETEGEEVKEDVK